MHSNHIEGNRVRGGAPIILTQGAWGCSKSHVPVTDKHEFKRCSLTDGWEC